MLYFILGLVAIILMISVVYYVFVLIVPSLNPFGE